MTFSALTYQIDGGNTSSQLWRQMAEALSLASPGGITNPLDMICTATGTNNIVSISGGECIIDGVEIANQGAYYGYNVGIDTSVTIAATSGSPRTDMVVVRVEDPTFSGSPWGGSPAAQTIFPRVISGVSSSATWPPGGVTAIPLCLVNMPASTTNVQQSYIVDLRVLANPKRQRTLLQASGAASPVSWTVGTSPTAWPALATWQVPVPAWGTGVKISWVLEGCVYIAGGNAHARGNVYPVFGASVSAPNQTFTSTLASITSATTFLPCTISGSADATVSTALRGTTQTLQLAQTTDGTNTGIIEVTEGSVFKVDIEFYQKAVTS
jgi:hypothetical protein